MRRPRPVLTQSLRFGATSAVLLAAACVVHQPFHAQQSVDDPSWQPVPAVDAQISDGTADGEVLKGGHDHCSTWRDADLQSKATAAIERTYFNDELIYTLGFLDVADQGHFWSETQVSYVIDELTARPEGAEPNSPRAPSIFVLYVPGWTHNGWTCDTHVRNFRRALELAGKKERVAAKAADRSPRQVRGLYFGWQGQGAFGGRKAAADRAGRSAGVALLGRLGPFLRELRDDELSTSILVGQSLGAAVLNETVASHFLTQLGEVRGGERKAILGPADLVVYLNPAFEESRFSQIGIMWQDALAAGQVVPEQSTQLIVYQTKGDRATESLFPVFAQFLPTGKVASSQTGGTRYGAIGKRAQRAARRDPSEQFGCAHAKQGRDDAMSDITPTGFYAVNNRWFRADRAVVAKTQGAPIHCGWLDGVPSFGDGRLFRYAYDEGRVRIAYGHSDIFNAALISWIWETAGSLSRRPVPRPTEASASPRDAGAESGHIDLD